MAADVVSKAASANEAITAASTTSFPDAPPETGDTFVTLSGGSRVKGEIVRKAVVRELTGADEEKLARALKGGNFFHYMETVLECGTVTIGDLPEEETQAHLRDLLIGDREAILLQIRVITYGAEVELVNVACTACGEVTESITLALDEDVPVTKLKDTDGIEFDVKLRKGATARVHLPSGKDQAEFMAVESATPAEQNSILLSRVMRRITGADGKVRDLVRDPDYVRRELGIADRRTLVDEITKRQPGPQYSAIPYVHEECGKKATLAIGLAALFLV